MREYLKDKKRIVIKIGSSSITHEETGDLNLSKIEKLVRHIGDLRGMGKEVILVTSGAAVAGRQAMGYKSRPSELQKKQALAAIGQARLIMIYQRIFAEYNMTVAQILMSKYTVLDDEARTNVKNTFRELLQMGAVPIVNENDATSTYEFKLGDNDRLSAMVTNVIEADLLILLSDIDGLYTDDPRKNDKAGFISTVKKVDDEILALGKDTESNVGTGGMTSKLKAAYIATNSGADMIIANADNLDIISEIMAGVNKGTIFIANKNETFDLKTYIINEDK